MCLGCHIFLEVLQPYIRNVMEKHWITWPAYEHEFLLKTNIDKGLWSCNIISTALTLFPSLKKHEIKIKSWFSNQVGM